MYIRLTYSLNQPGGQEQLAGRANRVRKINPPTEKEEVNNYTTLNLLKQKKAYNTYSPILLSHYKE